MQSTNGINRIDTKQVKPITVTKTSDWRQLIYHCMMTNKILLQELVKCSNTQSLVKLTLAKPRLPDGDTRNVFVKPVLLKSGLHWSFVYRYPTKDVTKNFLPIQAIAEIEKLINDTFYNADLITEEQTFYFQQFGNGKSTWSSVATPKREAVTKHNKAKASFIDPMGNVYLQELGVVSKDGVVKKDMYHKFRQINRYIELIAPLLKEIETDELKIVDMGSGKGYLTFALYDYLENHQHKKVNMIGVEMREELVSKGNSLATKCEYHGLRFESGSIQASYAANKDILIALHACDVATDLAIAAGIKSNSKLIVCSPCCHKQLRKQLNPVGIIAEITSYGILEERLAEMLTDTIRALYLQAYGYETKLMEFVSTEHIPKNLLLTAISKKKFSKPDANVLDKIDALKSQFGVSEHALDKLLL